MNCKKHYTNESELEKLKKKKKILEANGICFQTGFPKTFLSYPIGGENSPSLMPLFEQMSLCRAGQNSQPNGGKN